MLKFWVHIPQKGMMKINEKSKLIKSLNELENEFKKGSISKNQYEIQKSQLNQRLETLEIAERVMKLQGKKTMEKSDKTSDDNENEELFRKFITSPGLKEKNISNKKGISQNTMIASALLIVAFVIGIGFGIYALNIPSEVSSVSLSTNDSAFPPYVLNNTTNMTNMTNTTPKIIETPQPTETPVSQPAKTDQHTDNTPPTQDQPPDGNENDTPKAAGEPPAHRTYEHTDNNYSDE